MQQHFSASGLFAFVVLAAVGCGDKTTGSADAGPADAGMVEEVDPNGPWAKVYDEVIAPNSCDSAFCHGSAGELNLSLDLGYEELVGVAAMGKDCKTKTTKKRVEPYDPDASLLVEKMESPVCGERMPAGGLPKATTAQLKALRQWIKDGAKKN